MHAVYSIAGVVSTSPRQIEVETGALNAYALSDTVFTLNYCLLHISVCMNWDEFVPNLWPISAID